MESGRTTNAADIFFFFFFFRELPAHAQTTVTIEHKLANIGLAQAMVVFSVAKRRERPLSFYVNTIYRQNHFKLYPRSFNQE